MAPIPYSGFLVNRPPSCFMNLNTTLQSMISVAMSIMGERKYRSLKIPLSNINKPIKITTIMMIPTQLPNRPPRLLFCGKIAISYALHIQPINRFKCSEISTKYFETSIQTNGEVKLRFSLILNREHS